VAKSREQQRIARLAEGLHNCHARGLTPAQVEAICQEAYPYPATRHSLGLSRSGRRLPTAPPSILAALPHSLHHEAVGAVWVDDYTIRLASGALYRKEEPPKAEPTHRILTLLSNSVHILTQDKRFYPDEVMRQNIFKESFRYGAFGKLVQDDTDQKYIRRLAPPKHWLLLCFTTAYWHLYTDKPVHLAPEEYGTRLSGATIPCPPATRPKTHSSLEAFLLDRPDIARLAHYRQEYLPSPLDQLVRFKYYDPERHIDPGFQPLES
jgi:hypothetical protein